jgi:hypothetical protein
MDKYAAGSKWEALKALAGFMKKHKVLSATTGAVTGAGLAYGGKKLLIDPAKEYGGGIATYGDNASGLWDKGSYWNTFNPISSVTGGIDRLPEWYVKLFPKTTAGQRMAHTTFKAGATGLLAAGLVGGYRALRHYQDMADLEEGDRPAKGLAGHLSTTFEGDLGGEEDKKKQKKTAAFFGEGRIRTGLSPSWQGFFGTAIPMSAMLLAGGLAYKGVDSLMDKRRNAALDDAIAAKEDAIKQLIKARARQAKGTGTPKEIAEATEDLGDKDIYVKAASMDKEAILGLHDIYQHAGATLAAIVLASAIGSYSYTAASDENNIKFIAYKKALREYAKNKSGITPITIAPTDSTEYFNSIDGEGKQKATVREQPTVDTDDMNKPISVSL